MKQRQHLGQASRGFTLIEILLVIVIIGVMMGVAVVSLNPEDPERRLLRAREHLQGQLGLVRVMAERDQVELGVRLLPESWQFLRFRSSDRQWEIIADEPSLKPKSYPGLSFSWQDADAKVAPSPAKSNDRQGLTPDFLLMSSGEATPGIIHFYAISDARGLQASLTLTDIGDVIETERLKDTLETAEKSDQDRTSDEVPLESR